jgi:hypothetical protein
MKLATVTAFALVGAGAAFGGALAQDAGEGFALPREVVSAATAFQAYMDGAARIDAGFSNGEAVAKGLRTGAAYEPAQLEEGMIAYAAIEALQDDRFVHGVEDTAEDEGREAMAERLIENPRAVTGIDGAAEAARRIETALGAEASPLVSAGTQVKTAAYAVQRQAWSKAIVGDASGRLAEVKSLSAARAAPSEDDNQAMMLAVASARTPDDDGHAPHFSPIEARALALAAESVLGRAHGADRDRLSPLLTETDSAFCLKMAKLNLYQCMAVAGPQYEDIYCLGQHAMYDTAQCVDGAVHAGGATTVAYLGGAQPGPRPAYQPLAARRSLRADPN